MILFSSFYYKRFWVGVSFWHWLWRVSTFASLIETRRAVAQSHIKLQFVRPNQSDVWLGHDLYVFTLFRVLLAHHTTSKTIRMHPRRGCYPRLFHFCHEPDPPGCSSRNDFAFSSHWCTPHLSRIWFSLMQIIKSSSKRNVLISFFNQAEGYSPFIKAMAGLCPVGVELHLLSDFFPRLSFLDCNGWWRRWWGCRMLPYASDSSRETESMTADPRTTESASDRLFLRVLKWTIGDSTGAEFCKRLPTTLLVPRGPTCCSPNPPVPLTALGTPVAAMRRQWNRRATSFLIFGCLSEYYNSCVICPSVIHLSTDMTGMLTMDLRWKGWWRPNIWQTGLVASWLLFQPTIQTWYSFRLPCYLTLPLTWWQAVLVPGYTDDCNQGVRCPREEPEGHQADDNFGDGDLFVQQWSPTSFEQLDQKLRRYVLIAPFNSYWL